MDKVQMPVVVTIGMACKNRGGSSLEVRATDECCCSERGTSCFGDSAPIFKFESDMLPADERKKAVARSQNVGEVRRLCGVL